MPDDVNETGTSGFAPWPRTSPFGDAAGPLLFRSDGDALTFATSVEQRHTNATGGAHGGMLSTFADLALGYAAACSTDPPTPMRTFGLTIDFIGPVAVGDLVTARPQVLRVGKRLAHAAAVLLANGAPVARASATLAVVGQRRAPE
jgi:acyl-coenzyme A thioesterase 13